MSRVALLGGRVQPRGDGRVESTRSLAGAEKVADHLAAVEAVVVVVLWVEVSEGGRSMAVRQSRAVAGLCHCAVGGNTAGVDSLRRQWRACWRRVRVRGRG
jgi:hypothetical protein